MKLKDLVAFLRSMQLPCNDIKHTKTLTPIQMMEIVSLLMLDEMMLAWEQQHSEKTLQKSDLDQLTQFFKNHWASMQAVKLASAINLNSDCMRMFAVVAQYIASLLNQFFEQIPGVLHRESACWLEVLIPDLNEKNARELSAMKDFDLGHYFFDVETKTLVSLKQGLLNQREAVLSILGQGDEAALKKQLNAWLQQGQVSLTTLNRLLAHYINPSLWNQCLHYFSELQSFLTIVFDKKTITVFVSHLPTIQDTLKDQALVCIVLHAYFAKRAKGVEFNSSFAYLFSGSIPDKHKKLGVVKKILNLFNTPETQSLHSIYNFLNNPEAFLETEKTIATDGELGVILNKFFYENADSLALSSPPPMVALPPEADILSKIPPQTSGVLGQLLSIFSPEKPGQSGLKPQSFSRVKEFSS